MIHITHMNESRRTLVIWGVFDDEAQLIRIRLGAHVNESCRTYEQVMSHIGMIESCRTYE